MKLSKIRNISLVLLFVAIAFAGGYFQGKNRLKEELGLLVNVGQGSEKVDMSLFWDVWGRLETSYLDGGKGLDTQEGLYGAIRGMTASLGDPYTAFLSPDDNKRSHEDLSGQFYGVGIQLGFIDSTLAVMSPLPGNPAIKAGIRPRDLILKIVDEGRAINQETQGISLAEAVSLIRGERGTPIKLTVLSEGAEQPKEVEIVRDTINVPSVELSWVDGGKVAHLQVTRFGEKTLSEWLEAVDQIQLKREGGAKLEGVVLDLRNNPGGYMQGAIDLAAEFMSQGVVVQQQGRQETETFSVQRRGKLIGTPLVVLVNQGSASASEILAGALRQQLGVKIVGMKTFGKGTVQEAQDLPGGAGLHITIARWLLPQGENIHGEGIKPDVEVEYDYSKPGSDSDNQLERAIKVLVS